MNSFLFFFLVVFFLCEDVSFISLSTRAIKAGKFVHATFDDIQDQYIPSIPLYKLVHAPRIMEVQFFSKTRFLGNLKGRYHHLIFHDEINITQKGMINTNIWVYCYKNLKTKLLLLVCTSRSKFSNTLNKIR